MAVGAMAGAGFVRHLQAGGHGFSVARAADQVTGRAAGLASGNGFGECGFIRIINCI